MVGDQEHVDPAAVESLEEADRRGDAHHAGARGRERGVVEVRQRAPGLVAPQIPREPFPLGRGAPAPHLAAVRVEREQVPGPQVERVPGGVLPHGIGLALPVREVAGRTRGLVVVVADRGEGDLLAATPRRPIHLAVLLQGPRFLLQVTDAQNRVDRIVSHPEVAGRAHPALETGSRAVVVRGLGGIASDVAGGDHPHVRGAPSCGVPRCLTGPRFGARRDERQGGEGGEDHAPPTTARWPGGHTHAPDP